MPRTLSTLLLLCGIFAGRINAQSGDVSFRGKPEPIELEIPIFAGAFGTGFYEETAALFAAIPRVNVGEVSVRIHGDPRMHDKMRIRVIDGSLPDATFTELPWLNLVRAGKVLDLTPWLDGPNWEGDARWRDTFIPGVLETWTIDGRVYGVPLNQSCWTIFYNKRLFREHGWSRPRTWDEFFALCQEIKTTEVAPVALPGVYLRYGDAFLRAAFFNQVGREGWRAYNALEPGTRSDPRFARAAGVFQRIVRENLVAGWEGMTHTAAQLSFVQGRAAMVVSGSWFLTEMKGKIPEDFELGAMNFPVFPEGIGEPTAVQGSSEYWFAFAKGDPERERLTVDFLRYLTSRERVRAFVTANDAPVAIRGVPREMFSERMQETAAMLDDARDSYSAPPNMLLAPGLNQALTDERYALATGRITPEEFGIRLEAAASGVRARAETAHTIVPKHRLAGLLLLLGLTGAFAWTAVGVVRRLRVSAVGPARTGETRDDVLDDPRPVRAAETPAAWFGPLRGRLAVLFVGPSFLLFAAAVLVPGAASFVWSLTDWDSLNPREWVGLFHFEWLFFESDVFWRALAHNLFLMVVPAVVVVPLALFFAVLIHRGVAGARIFRACFLFPNILGGVAATLIWLNAYDPANGFINSGITEVGQWAQAVSGDWWLPQWLLGFQNHAWLAPHRLYWALIPIFVWLMVGFNLVLYLAAMEGIDAQYYEAAELDGAGPVAQFLRVTLPMIREVIAISVVFIVIGGLNTFEMIWLLTAQDPSSETHVLSTWMVSTMFKDFQIGRAAAIAVVMFVLVLAGSAVTLLAARQESVET